MSASMHIFNRFKPEFSYPAWCAALMLCASAQAEVSPLSQQQCMTMQQRGVYSDGNPVPCQRLARVTFRYHDFGGKLQSDGQIVVLDAVAAEVQDIFDELAAQGFPLQQARPMEIFGGDDEASMAANNTSAFNGRPVTGGKSWSKHAYGVAIDINPLQNPYISTNRHGKSEILPAATTATKRTPQRAGMAEPVRDIFFRHGFLIWGGDWKQPIDYQHFEIGSRRFIEQLLAMTPAAAKAAFASYANSYRTCMLLNNDDGHYSPTCAAQVRK